MGRWFPWPRSKLQSTPSNHTLNKEIRKRENPNEIDTLPKELLEIWTPLLESVASSHPTFPYALVMNIVNTVLYGKQIANDDELSRKDKSYGQCLARWAVFVIDRWGANQNAIPSEEGKAYLVREDVAAMLLTALGSSDVIESSERSRSECRLFRHPPNADTIARSATYLLQLLCKGRPELSELPTTLLPLTRSVTSQMVRFSFICRKHHFLNNVATGHAASGL